MKLSPGLAGAWNAGLSLPDDLSQQNYLGITVANKRVKALQHPVARNIRITLRLRHDIVI